MSAAQDSVQRQNLEALQSELASRKSTLQFAHSGVAFVVAFVLLCSAMKLVWDAKQAYVVAAVPCVLGCALICYGCLRYRDGRRLLRGEHEAYRELVKLRQALGVSDPAALLPDQ